MKIFGFLLLIFCPFVGLTQEHYKIYSTGLQKVVTIEDVLANVDKADVLFFGEEHDDTTCHVLEALLLQKIAGRYPEKTALSMEMFETDCQNVLDEYLAGLIREKNFITDARAWHNYKDYRPMIEYAKTNHIAVIAANAPSRYVNMVSRMGIGSLNELNRIGKSYLPPLPIDTATGAYYDKFEQIMGGHSSAGGMQMYQAQNTWDATMGWSVARFLKKHEGYKILQINGGFHSEDKLGAAAQLKKYDSKARIINIACFSDDSFDNPDWTKYRKDNDYIILTDPKLPKTY
jgi:uncharacterized iron-regulated protein